MWQKMGGERRVGKIRNGVRRGKTTFQLVGVGSLCTTTTLSQSVRDELFSECFKEPPLVALRRSVYSNIKSVLLRGGDCCLWKEGNGEGRNTVIIEHCCN